MPPYLNKNLFESADYRSRFLKIYRKLKGVDKACKALGITTTPLYTYRGKAKNPSKEFNTNRKFLEQMKEIKEANSKKNK